MDLFNIFITYIILLKITYLIFLLRSTYYKYKYKQNLNRIDYYVEYKRIGITESFLETLLMISISILMIILFHPKSVDKHTPIMWQAKQILFLFAIVLIFQQIKKSITIPEL